MDIRTAVSAPLSNSTSAGFGTTAVSSSSSAPAPAAAAMTSAPVNPISRAEAEQAAKTINKFMESASQNLEFSVDDDLDKVVVKIVDRTTRDVIRQIPTEEALSISKSLDKLQGLLVNEKA